MIVKSSRRLVASSSLYLPVRVMLVLAAGHGADVGLLGGQVRGDPVLEVVPGQVVLISNKYFHMFTNIFWCVCKYFYLQVPVGVLGCSLELADGADLDSVLSGVARNSWGKMSKLVKQKTTNAFNVSLSNVQL